MKYKVNSIFASIQGEGVHIGSLAVFVRFSGCNMQCPFCDTDHSKYKEMTADEIVREVERLLTPDSFPFIVLTGGEPMLQLDVELMKKLKALKSDIHIETNGTIYKEAIFCLIDWVSVSPKGELAIPEAFIDEIKVVVNKDTKIDAMNTFFDKAYDDIFVWLQPESMKKESIAQCIRLATDYPTLGLRVGIQMHKLYGVE